MGGVRDKLFLFTLITMFSLNVKAEVRKLDMAPYAVDDSFSQCQDTMLKAVTKPDGLLQKDLNKSKVFEELWSKYNGVCEKKILGGTSYHVDALQVYANSNSGFRKSFNDLVYSKGRNSMSYRNEFTFKSLHFLLTDSLRLLNPTNTCRTVYADTENTYTADIRAEVRFGKFLKASLRSRTEDFYEGTVFIITSCSVVNVEESTCKSEEIQCLISPSEVFTVENIRDVKDVDGTYKEITLKHSRFLNRHKCSFFYRSDLLGSSAPLLTSRILVSVMSYLFASHLFMSLL